jgi:hypothetical protein
MMLPLTKFLVVQIDTFPQFFLNFGILWLAPNVAYLDKIPSEGFTASRASFGTLENVLVLSKQ